MWCWVWARASYPGIGIGWGALVCCISASSASKTTCSLNCALSYPPCYHSGQHSQHMHTGWRLPEVCNLSFLTCSFSPLCALLCPPASACMHMWLLANVQSTPWSSPRCILPLHAAMVQSPHLFLEGILDLAKCQLLQLAGGGQRACCHTALAKFLPSGLVTQLLPLAARYAGLQPATSTPALLALSLG